MAALFKVSLGVLAALGTGATGMGGLYYGTKVSINNKIGHEFLGNEEEFDASWMQKHDQLIDAAQDSLIPDLENIRQSYKTKQNAEGAKALKNWCNSMRNMSYKNIFMNANDYLLNLTKKYCVQPIKDRFQANQIPNLTADTDQSTFKTNYKKLNSHKEQDGKLDSELLALKNAFKSDPQETEWKALQNWCSKAFEKSFKGSKDNLFLLVGVFCKKG